MTSYKAKKTTRGPLTDKTNVFNMKLNKNKETNASTINLKSPIKKSTRIRKRNVFLDENYFQIDFPKICIGEDKMKKKRELWKEPIDYRTELYVKITAIPINRYINEHEEKTVTKENCETIVASYDTVAKALRTSPTSITKVNYGKNQGENTIVFKQDQKVSKQMASDIQTVNRNNSFCTKQLFVKIPWIESNFTKTNTVNTSTNQCRITRSKSILVDNISDLEDSVMNTNTENEMHTKELFVKIYRISDIDKGVDKEVKEQQTGNLKSNHNLPEKPVKILKFNLKTNTKESHNLRKLEHKNYAEESIIDTTNTDSENPNEPLDMNLEKKDRLPVYRKIIPDDYQPQHINQNDLYEFVDISPKIKHMIQRGRPRRSSVLFDKNTHKILQKIEENEAKEKKKHDRRKKKELKLVLKKTYDKKVEAIVSNIRKKTDKICKNNGRKLETSAKHYLTSEIHIQKDVPFNDNYSKVIQVNKLNDEMVIIAHHSAEVPRGREKVMPQKKHNASITENVTSNIVNKGNSPTGNGVITSKSHLDPFDQLKGSVNVPLTLPLHHIIECSDSDNQNADDDIGSSFKDHENMQLNDCHVKVIEIDNFNNDSSKVQYSTDMRLSNEWEKKYSKSMKNVTSRRCVNIQVIPSSSIIATNENFTTLNKVVRRKTQSDSCDKLNESLSLIQPILAPKSLDSISVLDSAIQNDIDSCFGFDEDNNPPVISSTPYKRVASKGAVHIMGNVVLRHGTQDDKSLDTNVRIPNANSTMIDIGIRNTISSPWRPDWINMRSNPHFVSVKSNALPRIDQELVLDHTLVKGFESLCTRTPKKNGGTPAKKAPVQQSILSFVGSNIEKENDLLQGSLFDYEAFNSPVKKNNRETKNPIVEAVKRNLENMDTIASSTPIQRRVLGDISNSSGEQFLVNSNSDDNTYFGFNESPLPKNSTNTHRFNGQNRIENIENDNIRKPSRFDLSVIKSYPAKDRKKKKVNIAEKVQIPDDSISLVEVSDMDNYGENIHLFEEPEEMLDNKTPAHTERKHRRKRLDSCDSHTGEHEKRRKRHKTKLEIEQEKWIEQFNHMCAEIDEHELEFE